MTEKEQLKAAKKLWNEKMRAIYGINYNKDCMRICNLQQHIIIV